MDTSSSSYQGGRQPESQGYDHTGNMNRNDGMHAYSSNNYAQQPDPSWDNHQYHQPPGPPYGGGGGPASQGDTYPDRYHDDPNSLSSNFGNMSMNPSAYHNQRNPGQAPAPPHPAPSNRYADHGPRPGMPGPPMGPGRAHSDPQRRPPPGAERPGTADGWHGRPPPNFNNQRRPPPPGSAMPPSRDGPGPYPGPNGRPPAGRGQPPPQRGGPMQFHRPRPPPPQGNNSYPNQNAGGGWSGGPDGYSQRYDRPVNGLRDLSRSQTMPQNMSSERFDHMQGSGQHRPYNTPNRGPYNEPNYQNHDGYRAPNDGVDPRTRGLDPTRGSVGDVLDLYSYEDPYGAQLHDGARSNSLRNDGYSGNSNQPPQNDYQQQPPFHQTQQAGPPGVQAHRSKSQPNLRGDGPYRPQHEPPLPFPPSGPQYETGNWNGPQNAGPNGPFDQSGHPGPTGSPNNYPQYQANPGFNKNVQGALGPDSFGPDQLRSRPPPQRAYPNQTPVEAMKPVQPPLGVARSSPNVVPDDPDALPEHPAPIRPGLASDNASVRSGLTQGSQNTQADPLVAQGRMSVHDVGPVSFDMLNLLRNEIASKPANQPANSSIQFRFAKRLVEASFVLVNDSDPKAARRSRENFILEAHRIIKKLSTGAHPYPEAMFYLANCYGDGSLGLEVDHDRAFSLYQSAAKLNHPPSAYRTAVCCEIGAGTKKELGKAVQWYKKAAALGDTAAMYKLGMILHKGLLGIPRNDREAIVWLKRAAEQADEENPHALHQLGILYESADGNGSIVRDVGYAKELFTKAAELGYPPSQYRLGTAYAYGLVGCPIDAKLSITWYSRAAASGDAESELALAGWYLTGAEGVLEQNDTEAYLWSRKAAEQGLAKAEFAVGHLTELGIGMDGKGSEAEARNWYFRAAGKCTMSYAIGFQLLSRVFWMKN
ncbi:hypothetical protein ABW21_db0200389 [Orbilia brochopaga]|nr:hypothetical protein ABW21_db0200389 [Drechslerella brochopaga]